MPAMIHALDHLLLGAPDPAEVSARLAIILGTNPGPEFPLANTTLRVTTAPAPALLAAAFAVENLDAARSRLARRGLPATDDRIDPAATHGIDLRLVERPRAAAASSGIGLDHVVIRTPNPERTVALYGGRLGLDLRLERRNWGTHFLFFRCGDLVVEVVHPLDEPIGDGPDAFSGLAFRAADLTGQHARLVAAGAPVSDLKPGRKPGTHLFTVRTPLAVVPTIFITLEKN
jgi:catechol 2,3-dioxygenase-like lactoylglutathione lyase family enzyme